MKHFIRIEITALGPIKLDVIEGKVSNIMGNRLLKEGSLYLRQHGENPVDWWPWCEEAFEVARKEGKLVLVSIGYSSCHWCHVMAHECFEDEYIADLMNRNFVCIKVDREERPDIDQMFVEVVQMITGRAGWPLNVFCLPDGRPFFGGTYFPPKDIGNGIIPWPQLLMRIVEYYRKSPGELEENGENIIQNLKLANNPEGEDLPKAVLIEGARKICATHDDEWGGFGGAPKFPCPTVLEYLFAVRGTEVCGNDQVLRERIDAVLVKTLKSMAHGGIYDQIGGGFSRYSVDRFWAVPHFEKMLYDNGLLMSVYTKGWLSYRLELFKSVVEEVVAWLQRELLTAFGVFGASLDADSEGVEGQFYVWSRPAVIEVLGDEDGRMFCDAYGITREGNFEGGASVLAWMYDDDEKRLELRPLREKLLKARGLRVGPGKDMKILVSWNSLVVRGLVEAGFYFGRPDWVLLAKRVVDWIWEEMSDGKDRLSSVYYEAGKKGGEEGYLDDYAFYAEACLALAGKVEWVALGESGVYIERARAVVDRVLKHFGDGDSVGFYFTGDEGETLIARKKYWWDQAIASGNASMVHCLSDLYALTGEACYEEKLNELRQGYGGLAKVGPNGVAYALAGFTEDEIGVAVLKIKRPSVEVLNKIQEALSQRPYRKIFLLEEKEKAGKEYQLCVGTQCFESCDSLEVVLKKIESIKRE